MGLNDPYISVGWQLLCFAHVFIFIFFVMEFGLQCSTHCHFIGNFHEESTCPQISGNCNDFFFVNSLLMRW